MSALQSVATDRQQSQGDFVNRQQSLSDFTAAMEAAGLLVRIKDEKRVDQLPMLMEKYPTKAVLVEKITGCEFSFLARMPMQRTSSLPLRWVASGTRSVIGSRSSRKAGLSRRSCPRRPASR